MGVSLKTGLVSSIAVPKAVCSCHATVSSFIIRALDSAACLTVFPDHVLEDPWIVAHKIGHLFKVLRLSALPWFAFLVKDAPHVTI